MATENGDDDKDKTGASGRSSASSNAHSPGRGKTLSADDVAKEAGSSTGVAADAIRHKPGQPDAQIEEAKSVTIAENRKRILEKAEKDASVDTPTGKAAKARKKGLK